MKRSESAIALRPAAAFTAGSIGRPRPAKRIALASRRSGRLAIGIASLLVVLIVWQQAGAKFPFATSYPTAVARAMAATAPQVVIPAFGYTLETFGIGFGICVVTGIPLGLAMARIKALRVIIEPYTTVIYSTPFLSFFPLLMLLVGINFDLQLACVVVTAFFPIVINVFLGAREVDKNLVDVGTVFKANRFQMLRTIIFPGSLPYIFSGLRLGFARGMIGAVVIEMDASAAGIGDILSRFGKALEIADYFVAIILLGIFSILASGIIKGGERWATRPWARPCLPRSVSVPVLDAWSRVTESLRTNRVSGRIAAAVSSVHVPTISGTRLRRSGIAAGQKGVAGQRANAKTRWDEWPRSAIGARLLRIAAFFAILAVWQLYASGQSSVVMPNPIGVARSFWKLTFVTGSIWGSVGGTCFVLVVSFLIALLLGIPIGLLMGRSRIAESVLDPYVSFFYALPHVALVPLMVVWLGFGLDMQIVYAVFSGLFAMVINTMSGARNVDPEMINVGVVFCASKRRTLRDIVIPATLPAIIAGARQTLSMVWVGVVVAQLIATLSGLGGLITYYSNFFYTETMIVPIIFIMLISLVIVKCSTWLQGRLAPWAPSAR